MGKNLAPRSARLRRADQSANAASDSALQPVPGEASIEAPSLEERIAIREAFFRESHIDPRQFIQAFDAIVGLDYFVKDIHGRTLLNTRKYAAGGGVRSEERFVALRAGEYLARSLAQHYEADDQQVIASGEPLRNIVEIRLNHLGIPDWIVTDKHPLRNTTGQVVGIIGIMQSFQDRIRALPHLGDVGAAADYIRENLSRPISLDDVAAHVGISKRHLQRLFHQAIGMSIQQFIIHSRVHTAARQLTIGSTPLAQIAIDCGFTDQSAFTNTFRRVIGLAPREYRKQFLQDLTPQVRGR